jgi:hypothetical protein
MSRASSQFVRDCGLKPCPDGCESGCGRERESGRWRHPGARSHFRRATTIRSMRYLLSISRRAKRRAGQGTDAGLRPTTAVSRPLRSICNGWFAGRVNWPLVRCWKTATQPIHPHPTKPRQRRETFFAVHALATGMPGIVFNPRQTARPSSGTARGLSCRRWPPPAEPPSGPPGRRSGHRPCW